MAPLRSEPRDDAEQVTQALRGEPLTVVAERGGWAHVETAYGYPGWVRVEALGPPSAGEWPAPRGTSVLAEARAYVGAPYEWGGMSERGIDCSGLVHMAYRRVGRLVPRDACDQEEAGTDVREEELRPGDLLTYGEGERADHVAFWLGAGRILHATGRPAVRGVVEEEQPEDLAARFRRRVRLG